MNSFSAFLHGIGVAIGTAFIAIGAFFGGQQQASTTTPITPPAAVATSTPVEKAVVPAPVANDSNPPKKPTSLPAAQPIQTPVIQVPSNTPTATQQPQTAQASTKAYYENGSYVYLTDEEHEALLQQLKSTIQSLQSQEQPYIDDLNKAEAEIQKACASVGSGAIGEGNAAIAAQTQASICSSTSQAYSVSIQIDRQSIDYYEGKIQALKAAYN